MRGKVVFLLLLMLLLGITPAYAGKRRPACTLMQHRRGSPPPMRGKVMYKKRYNCCIRITPAYAGKSFAPYA